MLRHVPSIFDDDFDTSGFEEFILDNGIHAKEGRGRSRSRSPLPRRFRSPIRRRKLSEERRHAGLLQVTRPPLERRVRQMRVQSIIRPPIERRRRPGQQHFDEILKNQDENKASKIRGRVVLVRGPEASATAGASGAQEHLRGRAVST